MDHPPAPRVSRRTMLGASVAAVAAAGIDRRAAAEDKPKADAAPAADASTTKAFIDGLGYGFRAMTQDDFTNVNLDPDGWTWDEQNVAHCKGHPVGVFRSVKAYTNFEIVFEWMMLQYGGNSGMFVWCPEAAWKGIPRNALAHGGFEIQVLDHGYTDLYEKQTHKKATWFTTNGDVFPVGSESKFKPFPPTSPNGVRSFPSKNLSHGVNQWNHYYVRCINGEIRLWVNGEEVSGGTDCNPRTGYICLESEGAPVKFRNIHIRELP